MFERACSHCEHSLEVLGKVSAYGILRSRSGSLSGSANSEVKRCDVFKLQVALNGLTLANIEFALLNLEITKRATCSKFKLQSRLRFNQRFFTLKKFYCMPSCTYFSSESILSVFRGWKLNSGMVWIWLKLRSSMVSFAIDWKLCLGTTVRRFWERSSSTRLLSLKNVRLPMVCRAPGKAKEKISLSVSWFNLLKCVDSSDEFTLIRAANWRSSL